jgi:D-serine deaminase-like pyridoxal phosphate-dependent protein
MCVIGDRQQVAVAVAPTGGQRRGDPAGRDRWEPDVDHQGSAAVPVGLRNDPGVSRRLIERVSDCHGQVRFAVGARIPNVGQIPAAVPNHACPVIDLYDTSLATRGGTFVGEWRVDARIALHEAVGTGSELNYDQT